MLRRLKNRLLIRIDIILAILGVASGIAVGIISIILGLGQSGVGFAIALGSGIYILKDIFQIPTSRGSPLYGWKLPQIMLVISLTVAIYFGLTNRYDRPDIYYLAFGSAGVALAWATLVTKRHAKYWHPLLLGEIIIFSLIYRTFRYYQYPLIPGNDINFHIQVAQFLASTSEMPVWSGKYMTANLFHHLLAVGVNLGLAPKDAIYFFAVIPFAITTITGTYLIGRTLDTPRSGIFASIFAAAASMMLVRGVTSITPSALVISITPLTILFLIRWFDGNENPNSYEKSAGIIGLLSLSSIALFTHQLSSLILMVVLTSYLFSSNVYYKLWTHKNPNYLPTIIALGVLLIMNWMVTPGGDVSLLGVASRRFLQSITSIGGTSGGYAESLNEYSILSNLLYLAGYYALLCLGVLGGLHWLRHSEWSQSRIGLITALLAVFMLVYPATFFGLDQFLIPHRILVFLVFGLVILGGVAIDRVAIDLNMDISVAIIVGLIVFASITAPFLIRGDPVYGDERVYRTELTEEELIIIQESGSIKNDGKVYVDHQVSTRAIEAGISSINRGDVNHYPVTGQSYHHRSLIIDRGVRSDSSETFGANSRRVVQPSKCLNRQKVIQVNSLVAYWIPNKCPS